MIDNELGLQEVYDLQTDPFEKQDLLESGSVPAGILDDLEQIASEIRQ